jgi:hypothetical protein
VVENLSTQIVPLYDLKYFNNFNYTIRTYYTSSSIRFKNSPLCLGHFFHNKSHIDYNGIKPSTKFHMPSPSSSQLLLSRGRCLQHDQFSCHVTKVPLFLLRHKILHPPMSLLPFPVIALVLAFHREPLGCICHFNLGH